MISIKPFARGCDGESRLEVGKDRYGYVRSLQGGRAVSLVKFLSLADGAIRVEIQPPILESTDPALSGLRPAARRVLTALEGPAGQHPGVLDVRAIGDLVAIDGGLPLKARTIQDALKSLKGRELAVPDGPGGLWRASTDQIGGENGS